MEKLIKHSNRGSLSPAEIEKLAAELDKSFERIRRREAARKLDRQTPAPQPAPKQPDPDEAFKRSVREWNC